MRVSVVATGIDRSPNLLLNIAPLDPWPSRFSVPCVRRMRRTRPRGRRSAQSRRSHRWLQARSSKPRLFRRPVIHFRSRRAAAGSGRGDGLGSASNSRRPTLLERLAWPRHRKADMLEEHELNADQRVVG